MNKKTFKKGFTLVELLLVISIIGILTTLMLTTLSTSRERARIVRAQAEVKQIYLAMAFFDDDNEQWPNHKASYAKECNAVGNEICAVSDGCSLGMNDPGAGLTQTDGTYPGWEGPYYMPEVPIDPWGHEYFLDTDYFTDLNGDGTIECSVIIGSFGPNGIGLIFQDGGAGDDQDDNNGDDIIYYISSRD